MEDRQSRFLAWCCRVLEKCLWIEIIPGLVRDVGWFCECVAVFEGFRNVVD